MFPSRLPIDNNQETVPLSPRPFIKTGLAAEESDSSIYIRGANMKRYRLFQNIGLLTAMSFALVSCFKDELVGSRVNSRSNIIGFGISAATTADGTPLTRATQYADSALLMLGRGGADTLYLHASSENNISALDTSVATRGVPVNSSNFSTVCKNFSVSAFTPTEDYYMKNVKVDNLANGIWSSDEEHFWPEDEEMTLDFFAYAPAVFGENPVFAEDDIQYNDPNGKIMSFNYTVPGSGESVTNAAELQPDIMFAYSSQNKKDTDPATGSVPLKFYHALAGVKFVAKDITGGTVKSITLKNLYGTGTCTYTFTTGEPTIAWTDLDGQDYCSFSQEFNVKVNNQQTGEQDITDKKTETTFMMIPQNIQNAVVEILFNDGKTDYTLTGKLYDPSITSADNDTDLSTWDPGKIYTYAISTESINWTYVFDVTENIDLKLGQTSDTYTVTSYRYRTQFGDSENNREPVSWTAKNTAFSETNKENGQPVEITYNQIVKSFTDKGGETGTIANTYQIELEGTTMHTTYDNDEHTLRNNPTRGAEGDFYDLSKHDLKGNPIARSTANCYVVNADGYYKLPLVYGNAIQDGNTNNSAYNNNAFTDYKGNRINSPNITGADDATLVWSDGFFMFKDIKLSEDKEYLTFRIDPDYLQQANAVLAVRDADDNIMWSWHIWVTERDIYSTHTITDFFNQSNTFELMSCNLGWVDGKMVYYNQRDLAYQFIQADSGKTASMTVLQEGEEFDYKDVGSTYYQWGRKDPLVAMRNWENVKFEDYRLHETGRSDYGYDIAEKRVSIAESIQHPNLYYVRGSTSEAANWCSSDIPSLWNTYGQNTQITNDKPEDVTLSTKTIYDPSPRGFKVPIPRAFAVFVNGTHGDGGQGGEGNFNGELNGVQVLNGKVKNQYRVFTKPYGQGDQIPFTATGQRADKAGLSVYVEGDNSGELGGLWSMYGVYYWTCVALNNITGYSFLVRHDQPDENPKRVRANSYKFNGTKTMARPVRPIKE